MKNKIKFQYGSNKYGMGLVAFVINFLVAFMIFFPSMAKNHGLLTLCNDFNLQQIPLNILSNRAFKTGNLGWTWNVDIGSDFVGATSFYVTGSPFFYLSLLFSPETYPKLVGWLLMLKYAVAGVTSYVYIAQYVKNKRYALIGCMLYAFSGFQATNLLFYHFHDVVAFFPLLLFGVDQLVEHEKKGILAFAAFLGTFINFYFFVGEVVFLVIYFIFKYWVTDWKYWKKFLQCLGEGLLGVCMAMVIFLPSMAFNLENPRASQFLSMSQWFDMNKRYLLHVLRTYLLPANTMMEESYVVNEDYSSWAAYLPMVGLIPVVAFQWHHKKHWMTRLSLILVVMSTVPVLNSLFYFATSNNYHRWLNMLVLIMATMVCIELEEAGGKDSFENQKRKNRWGIVIVGVLCTIFTAVLWKGSIWWDQHKFQVIFEETGFRWVMMVAVLGSALTTVIHVCTAGRRAHSYAFLAGIMVFSVLTTKHVYLDYKSYHTMDVDYGNLDEEAYYERILAYAALENPDEAFRFATMDNISNMVGNLSGDSSFTSTVNGSIIELHEVISEGREVFTPFKKNGMNELFSAKYVIESQIGQDQTLISQSEKREASSFTEDALVQEIHYKDGVDRIYEMSDILPLGYSYHSYMTQKETAQLSNDERLLLMLQTLIIPDEEEDTVKETLAHFSIEEANFDWDSLKPQWQTYHHAHSSTFTRGKNRFSSTMTLPENAYVFFSVPFDKNWSATVNGKEVEIISIHGLMAVKADAGENQIEFTYRNPSVWLGGIVSLIAFAVWLFYRRDGKKKITKESSRGGQA